MVNYASSTTTLSPETRSFNFVYSPEETGGNRNAFPLLFQAQQCIQGTVSVQHPVYVYASNTKKKKKEKKASRWLMSEYRLGGWDESAPSRKWKGIKYRLVGSQEQQPRDGQPPCSNNSNSPPSPPKGMLCCAGPSSSYSMLYHPAAAHVRRASYWFGRPFRVCASISRRSQLSSSNSQKERERERERHYGSCRPMSLRRGKHGRLKRLQDAPLATVLTTAIQSLRLEVMDRQRINGTYNAHVP